MPNETHTNLIAKLTKERDDLTTVIAVLQKRAGGSAKGSSAKSASTGVRKPMSAAARKRISDAQKARWAKVKTK